MRKIFTITILVFTINAFAQVPTNGLVGYWAFNGNAIDASGNNLNGIVTNATLTTDRFGNVNSAYSFNGTSSLISVAHNTILNAFPLTINFWFKTNQSGSNGFGLINKYYTSSLNGFHVGLLASNGHLKANYYYSGSNYVTGETPTAINDNIWHMASVIYDNVNMKIYIDNVLKQTIIWTGTPLSTTNTRNLLFGKLDDPTPYYFLGNLDDIRIYNRALSSTEVSALYTECKLGLQITPSAANVATAANAQFSVTSTDANAIYQWQTNPENIGWLNITSNTTYTGANSATLGVNKVQLSNHLQPFRVIATDGVCKDTSITASIKITDTCIVTTHKVINDTVKVTKTITDTIHVTQTTHLSVSDTLIIKATLTGIATPNNTNTLKVYPNPAKDHISIYFGNVASMNGYTVKIVNSVGKTVFSSAINQQTSFIDLSSWSGKGVYIINIIDGNNTVIESRKIVLE